MHFKQYIHRNCIFLHENVTSAAMAMCACMCMCEKKRGGGFGWRQCEVAFHMRCPAAGQIQPTQLMFCSGEPCC